MHPSIHLDGVELSTYLLALVLGATTAVGVSYRTLRRERWSSTRPTWAMATLLACYLAALFGGRAFFVLEQALAGRVDNLGKQWISGGLVSHGAFFFAFAALWLSTRWARVRHVPQVPQVTLLRLLDGLAPAVGVAGAAGRVGCFLAGCCYGHPTASFIGLVFPETSPAARQFGELIAVHPTQLYEVAAYGVAAYVAVVMPRGKFFALVATYTSLRFAIEFFRADSIVAYLGLNLPQWYCALMLLVVIVYVLRTLSLHDSYDRENQAL